MPSRHLQPLEVIAEVRRLRIEIEQRVARVFELSESLASSVKRGNFRLERDRIEADIQLLQSRLERTVQQDGPPEVRQQLQIAVDGAQAKLSFYEETVTVYLMFANTWKRFAGSMHQGLKRTASADRVVEQVQRRQGIEEPPKQESVARTPEPPVEDLVELYGNAFDD